MNLRYPRFGVNVKVYPQTSGEDALALARTLEDIQRNSDGHFGMTPQIPDLRLIASETDINVSAAMIDPVTPGRGIGKLLPETLASAGADAAIINHVENRDSLSDIVTKIERCREVGIDSVICVDSIEMGRAIANFDPDVLLFEKPEDISTDRAITQTHPERVERFVAMVDAENPQTKVSVGGGISTPDDVRRAFELGADATGASSAICTADDPEALLRDIGAVM